MKRPVTLTPREAEVVDILLCDGASNKEIAEVMGGLSEDTIKSHMRAVIKKCGVANRTELAVSILRGKYEFTVKAEKTGRKPRADGGL